MKPEVTNVITLSDIRRCGQAGTFLNSWSVPLHLHPPSCAIALIILISLFFWCLRFNLNKFLSHESRDATSIFADRSNTDSDWIKYAKVSNFPEKLLRLLQPATVCRFKHIIKRVYAG